MSSNQVRPSLKQTPARNEEYRINTSLVLERGLPRNTGDLRYNTNGCNFKHPTFNTLTGSCFDSVIDPSDTSGDGSTEVDFPSSDAYLDNVGEAWCSSASSGNAYLQVDFGSLKVVCAIAVQGLSADGDEVFPTSFKLSFAYTDTDHEWAQFYKEGGVDRVRCISQRLTLFPQAATIIVADFLDNHIHHYQGPCNSHNKPMQRHFHRPGYF